VALQLLGSFSLVQVVAIDQKVARSMSKPSSKDHDEWQSHQLFEGEWLFYVK
jgi:hypothetical protein